MALKCDVKYCSTDDSLMDIGYMKRYRKSVYLDNPLGNGKNYCKWHTEYIKK